MAVSCALSGSGIWPVRWRDRWDALLGFPHQQTAHRVLSRWLQEFTEGKKPRWSLVLESSITGVGKSRLVRTAGVELCRRGLSAVYCAVPSLMDELREAQGPHSEFGVVQVRRRYCRAGLLILDDMGKCRVGAGGTVSPFVAEMLWTIINDRYERGLPVWATARKGPDELAMRWGPDYGPDILSRMVEMCDGMRTWIRMDGPDLRHHVRPAAMAGGR